MVTVLEAGVWWLDLPGTNAYLVDDGGTLTLVDTGLPWTARTVERAVERVSGGRGAGPAAAIDRVLLTHTDFDHVGGLSRIAGLDAPVVVGEADAPSLRGDERPPWNRPKGLLQRATEWWRSPPDLPIRTVADGDEIGSFTAYHTPGHTPGHTAFVSESLSVGAVGDLVYTTDGRLELPPRYLAYDHGAARRSLRGFAERTADFELTCHGHGTPVASGGAGAIRAAAARTGDDARG
ncbi:MAG: MBL fold metallo-hydrolase [Salinirussus sp.]